MTNDDALKERLKRIRKTLNLSQREISLKLNISHSTYNQIEAGSNNPNFEMIVNLAQHYRVNLYYLLFGKGSMFASPDEFEALNADKYYVRTEEMKEFLWYLENSSIVQYNILAHFKLLLSQNGEYITKELESKKKSRS